jgi:hypothetical protein
MLNAALALHYFIVFAFIQEHHDAEIRWNTHAILYVEIKKAQTEMTKTLVTFADIQQEVLNIRTSYYGNVKITGYHEITQDEYHMGLRLQKEEEAAAKNKKEYPSGGCIIL